jgi:hypothetical protein
MVRGKKPAVALGKVLFVRVDEKLLAGIDEAVARERDRVRGRTVSRADVVRTLLWRALLRRSSNGS